MERPANGAANADARLHDHNEQYLTAKPCGICGAMTALDQFSKRGRRKDGTQKYARHCHGCERERKRQAWHADSERNRKRARRRYWANVTEERRRGRERARSEKGRAVNRKAVARYKQRHPEKAAAHAAVKEALRTGTLVRPQTCEHPGCNSRRLDAHHSDYSLPLAVTWLCKTHHRERHRKPMDIELDGVAELPNSAKQYRDSNKRPSQIKKKRP